MHPEKRSLLLIRFLCAVTLLLAILLTSTATFDPIELFALDSELRLAAPRKASPEIVILALDDRAVGRYGPPAWPPMLMAKTIDALSQLHPKVIGLDFVYTGEGDQKIEAMQHERAGIADLAKAMKQSGRVIAGIFFDVQPDPELTPSNPPQLSATRIRQIRFLSGASPQLGAISQLTAGAQVHVNAPQISAATHSFGHLNMIPEPADGVIRWMPLVIRYEHAIYPSFAVEILRSYLGDGAVEVLVGKDRIEEVKIAGHTIKTDEGGRLFLRYAGGQGTFQYLSAFDLLQGRLRAESVRDRIVLIGTTAPATGDMWTTPMARLMPGVEIHANAIENLLRGTFLIRNWQARALSYGSLIVLCILGLFVLPSSRKIGVQRTAIMGAFSVLALTVMHYEFVTRTNYAVDLLVPVLTALSMIVGTITINYFSEEKQRKQVERSFAQYLDPKVIAELQQSPDRLRLGGERRELTVLFCDIRSFTTLSEAISPEAIVSMLHQFFDSMTNVIFEYEGLVDKFVGDQVMAFWGAPVWHEDHAAKACAAAVKMRKEFLRLRSEWSRSSSTSPQGKTEWKINCGIGINSGPMVVGNIGSQRRFSYTVIGDSVNVAARLEALNKTYGTQILAGPDTYQAAQERFYFREVDYVQVKGRSEPLTVYELLSSIGDEPPNAEWLSSFAEGLEAFRSGDFEHATHALSKARALKTDDACADWYLKQIAQPAHVNEG